MTPPSVWPDLSATVKGILTGGSVIIAATLGWSRMEAKVEAKADASEVRQLHTEIRQLSREIRTIRLMLCDSDKARDTYCRSEP